MDLATGHIRNGFGSVRPYVYGPAHLLDFVRQTFAAEVVERSSDGGQVEVRQAGVRDAFGNIWYIAPFVGGA